MNLVGFVLLAGLGADGGVVPDAGLPIPPWVPRTKRVDVSSEAEYGLRRAGEGYVYETPHFEARVGHDGVVHFTDRHGSISSFPFSSLAKGQKRQSTAAPEIGVRDPSASRRGPWLPQPSQPEPPNRPMEQSEICPPSSSCYSPFTANRASMVGVRGNFDLTDEIMRALGHDPYSLEKARFLSATFEFRIKMAIEARKADLKEAFERLPARLDDLWGDDRYSLRERRRILYELWYETDRTPEGQRAATIIRDFVHRHLPCGSPNSYTRAELDAFAKSHPARLLIPPDDCPVGPPDGKAE